MFFCHKNKIIVKILVFFVFIIITIKILSVLITTNSWVINTTRPCDIYWRLRWQKNFSSQQLATNYYIDSFDPNLGWSPLKNLVSNNHQVNFNNDGIRGLKNYSLDKPFGSTRIIVSGDSYSYGEEVSDSDTYSAQLEKILPNTEVLNMAVHGYGIDQMTLRLKLDGYKYHPDIVIYAFIDDDLNRAFLNFRDYAKPKYEFVNGQLQLKNVPIIKPADLYHSQNISTSIINLYDLLYSRLVNKPENHEPLIQAIWSKTYIDIKNNSAIPVFLYLPTGSEMIDKSPSDTEVLMFKFCKSVPINCLSAKPYLLEAKNNGVNLKTKGHYDALIHKIIAQGLAKDLQQLK